MQPPILQTDWRNQVAFEPERHVPHVESFFWHATCPKSHRALWVRLSLFVTAAQKYAEAHVQYVDAAHEVLWQGHERVDLTRMRMDPERAGVGIDTCSIETGASSGSLRGDNSSLAWRVHWTDEHAGYGLLPWHWLYASGRTTPKLTTPHPSILFGGYLELWRGEGRHVPVERLDLTGWRGMQGHSWGPALPQRCAWMHCNTFADAPAGTYFEAFAGATKLAGLARPLHVGRLGSHAGSTPLQRWRSLWQAPSRFGPGEWTFALEGRDATVRGRIHSGGTLGPTRLQHSPEGVRHTFLAMLAQLTLEVQPRVGALQRLHSDRAVLWIMQSEPAGSLAAAAD